MEAPEFPNIVSLIEKKFHGYPWAEGLKTWENLIFSGLVALLLILVTWFAYRRRALIPGRLQAAAEWYVEVMDDLVCGILGPRGRQYVPFIGTLFIYILGMNLSGFIPFLKSSTSSWSTTMALSLCVFFYVQYASFKELGVLGYLDHLMEKPRGAIAWTVILPVFMFLMHLLAVFIRPLTLSFRLRSNIWGDDMLMAIFAGFGLFDTPLHVLMTLVLDLPVYLFIMILSLLAALIQAFVFILLTTVYFALVIVHED